jgi:glycylpeptide N-tetradecanoyltransferase
MPQASSKEVDPAVTEEAVQELVEEDNGSSEDEEQEGESTEPGEAAKAKKKKSKKSKLKKMLGAKVQEDEVEEAGDPSKPASKLTQKGVEELLEMNPSLKAEIAGMDQQKAVDALRKLDIADLMTGMVSRKATMLPP